jgi:predicted HAD superfamily hydrolase
MMRSFQDGTDRELIRKAVKIIQNVTGTSMAKVGILYDNISGNTGDVAIGLSLKKILRDLNVPFDELIPGNFNPLEYETIIIGGGYLLRTTPDFFYDKFRIPGNHVLNAMGILGEPRDLEYLDNYKYISVQSNGDRKKLAGLKKDVHVIPCTTMLLEDLPDFDYPLKKPCIGMHILPLFSTPDEQKEFVTWASSLPFTIYFLPITHYNRDIDFMRTLAAQIPNAELLPILRAQEIFTLIGRFDYFISCSLHGAIFAYVHNVPFSVFDYIDKMHFFMEDRGLESYLFTNVHEMKRVFSRLLAKKPDYSQSLKKDKSTLEKYIRYLRTVLPTGEWKTDHSCDNIAQFNHQVHFLQQDALKNISGSTPGTAQNIQYYKRVLAERDNRIRQQKNRIQFLQKENDTLKRSIAFRITEKMHHSVIEPLFPPATRRRRYYDLGLEGGRILFNEGLGSLINSIRRYWRERRTGRHPGGISRISGSHPTRAFTIDSTKFRVPAMKKTAVHVHVFYPEIFDEIITYLSNIPMDYTLFVSVVREEDRTVILQKTRTMPHVKHGDIRVVNNRGRNIAPLLVEFGSELKNFDFICHIHTKKSLFTGTENADWRRYLFERLLGSPDMVKAIITAFETDPSIGIIYPEIYPSLPYWACTWLSNMSIAPQILTRLGIRFDPYEYFDYPVGSMFWIRKESLEPLLDLNLTLNDFPHEHGQTDGTLQHVLERCFVLAGQSRGFRHLVIRDPSGPLFSYRSTRNLDQYYAHSFSDRFRILLDGATVISFDIFDTLLIRPFDNPSMVLSYLEDVIFRKFGIKEYQRMRIRAEAIVRERKGNSGDVRISEIYAVFSELAKIDPDTAGMLLDLEVSTEKKLLIPRKEVINAARHAKEQGKRLILVSDTYFEQKNIDEILRSKGIDFFDAVYLSSETGKRKNRNDLWDLVIEREGVTPDTFLHIGDNEQSDIQKLVDRGYKNYIHIMRPSALFRQSDLGTLLWDTMKPSTGWRESLLYGKIANRLCANPNGNPFAQSGMVLKEPQDAGYIVFGPVIFTFMNWLIRISQQDNCHKLWFTTREGYLLDAGLTLFLTHPDLTGIRNNSPEHCYFHCSRRTAVFASLKTEKDLPRLIEGGYRGSLRDFLTKRLIISSVSRIEERLGTETLEQQIRLPEDYYRIYEILKRVLDILIRDAQEERDVFTEYCHQQGFTPQKRIAVVDMGYSATIQSALTDILKNPVDGYYFITESKASQILSSGCTCRGYFDEFVHPSRKKEPIHRYSLLLEAVLTAPTGQVIRFERNSSTGISPVFKEGGVSQKEFTRISHIHEGILAFIAEMIDEFGPAVLEIEFPEDLVQACYERVVTGDIDLGPLRTALSVEDDYCGNDEISPLEFYHKHRKN